MIKVNECLKFTAGKRIEYFCTYEQLNFVLANNIKSWSSFCSGALKILHTNKYEANVFF